MEGKTKNNGRKTRKEMGSNKGRNKIYNEGRIEGKKEGRKEEVEKEGDIAQNKKLRNNYKYLK